MHTDGNGDGRSIEEILASIRRLIYDTPDSTGTVPTAPSHFPTLYQSLDREHDAESNRALPVTPAEAGRLAVEAPQPAPEPWLDILSNATRTLESAASNLHPPALPPPGNAMSVPRTMVQCTDTIISRMGQARRQSDLNLVPTPATELPPPPSPVQPMMNDAPAPSNGGAWTALGHADDARMSKQLHDAAATALRPLLRDWLNTNMRVILEKALQDEIDSTKRK